jgi:Uncharacterized conserved protein
MKSSISAKIPTELYEEVQAAIKEEKYTSNTECIIKGLILLLHKPDQADAELNKILHEKEKEIQNLQEEVNSSKREIYSLQKEVTRSNEEVNSSKEDYTKQIKAMEENLRKAPDPIEFAQLRTRSEDKDRQIEEKDRHIDTLKRDLEQAAKDKETIQNLYDNYMRQMQTLIQQKAIEAPGNKKPWWKFW